MHDKHRAAPPKSADCRCCARSWMLVPFDFEQSAACAVVQGALHSAHVVWQPCELALSSGDGVLAAWEAAQAKQRGIHIAPWSLAQLPGPNTGRGPHSSYHVVQLLRVVFEATAIAPESRLASEVLAALVLWARVQTATSKIDDPVFKAVVYSEEQRARLLHEYESHLLLGTIVSQKLWLPKHHPEIASLAQRFLWNERAHRRTSSDPSL